MCSNPTVDKNPRSIFVLSQHDRNDQAGRNGVWLAGAEYDGASTKVRTKVEVVPRVCTGRLSDPEIFLSCPFVFMWEDGEFSAPRSRLPLGSREQIKRICVDRGGRDVFLAGFFLALALGNRR